MNRLLQRPIIFWGGGLWVLTTVMWIASARWLFFLTIGPLASDWFSVWCYGGVIAIFGPTFDASEWYTTHAGVVALADVGMFPSPWSWWEWHYYPGAHWSVAFPAWLPLVLAPLPFWAAPLIIRYRRSRCGQCITCGYLLTGNTTGRCPECGTCGGQCPADGTAKTGA